MKRMLFYCQHQLGIGHLSRAINIIDGCLDEFHVTLLQGGPDVGLGIEHPNFERVLLEPIQMRKYTNELYSPNDIPLSKVWGMREREIGDVLEGHFDVVVTELFPLGRKAFTEEILKLIRAARRKNSECKVICSSRDILVDPPDEESLEIVKNHYDKILIHSDENVIPLDERFMIPFKEWGLMGRIEYTGFVCSPPIQERIPRRPNSVIVSLGGGAVGAELIEGVLGAAAQLAELDFRIFTGVNIPEESWNLISESCLKLKNCTVERFSLHFERELSSHALSISMGGYNTMMNLVNTKTYGLVLPYDENFEQRLRGKLFESLGLVMVLDKASLRTESLCEIIRESLTKNPVSFSLNCQGSVKFKDILNSVLD